MDIRSTVDQLIQNKHQTRCGIILLDKSRAEDQNIRKEGGRRAADTHIHPEGHLIAVKLVVNGADASGEQGHHDAE